MKRLGAALCALAVAPTGCECGEIFGPTPENDPPVIESVGDMQFADASGVKVNSAAALRVDPGEVVRLPVDVYDPDLDPVELFAAPIPRRWSFDPARRLLTCAPDELQRGLGFHVFLIAEDDGDPVRYDAVDLEIWVGVNPYQGTPPPE